MTSIKRLLMSDTYGPGQQVFTESGTFIVPAGTTSLSYVMIGSPDAGGVVNGGIGGMLQYVNDVTVTPGESITITVPAIASHGSGATQCTFSKAGGTPSATFNGGARGAGGAGIYGGGGGGGAGGYSAAGGAGGAGGDTSMNGTAGTAGTGGSGGGGGGGAGNSSSPGGNGGIGGGTGLLGAGSNGTAGAAGTTPGGAGGNGGPGSSGSGALYGGAGGGGGESGSPTTGNKGAVRIIWPGDERQYPSTRTADE